MNQWYYYQPDSETAVGPLDEGGLRALRVGGVITAETLISNNEGTDWTRFADTPLPAAEIADASKRSIWPYVVMALGLALIGIVPLVIAVNRHISPLPFLFVALPWGVLLAEFFRGGRKGRDSLTGVQRAVGIVARFVLYPLALLLTLGAGAIIANGAFEAHNAKLIGYGLMALLPSALGVVLLVISRRSVASLPGVLGWAASYLTGVGIVYLLMALTVVTCSIGSLLVT